MLPSPLCFYWLTDWLTLIIWRGASPLKNMNCFKGGIYLEAGYGILAPNFCFFVRMIWKIDIVEGFDASIRCQSINPITPGVSDQRLLPGGVFRTPKLLTAHLELFLDLWNHYRPIHS